jgi:hypothetical protein
MRNIRDNITNQLLLQIREKVCGTIWIYAREVSDQVEGKVNGENLHSPRYLELRQIWIEVYLKGRHLIDQIAGQLGEIIEVRHKLVEQLAQREKKF